MCTRFNYILRIRTWREITSSHAKYSFFFVVKCLFSHSNFHLMDLTSTKESNHSVKLKNNCIESRKKNNHSQSISFNQLKFCFLFFCHSLIYFPFVYCPVHHSRICVYMSYQKKKKNTHNKN